MKNKLLFLVALVAVNIFLLNATTVLANKGGGGVSTLSLIHTIEGWIDDECFSGGPGASSCDIDAGIQFWGSITSKCGITCKPDYYACCGIGCRCKLEPAFGR